MAYVIKRVSTAYAVRCRQRRVEPACVKKV